MANYGKYYIVVRLLLLKQYPETTAARDRTITCRQIEAYIKERE